MIPEPPYFSLNFDITADTEDALVTGKKALSMFLELQSFHKVLLKENILIQAIVRKRGDQLRREKVLHLLKRVKACLQRVPVMDKLFTIAADIQKDVKMSLRGKPGHIPCRQSWAFVLYLISQYHGLLHQAVAYSLTTFQYLSNLVTVGHLLQVFVMFMGICARIWQVCRTFSDKLASVYNQLYPVQQHIPASKSDWLYPKLPTRLAETDSTPKSEYEKERVDEEPLIDGGSPINTPRVTDASSAENIVVDVPRSVQDQSDTDEDIGVAVSIEECQKLLKRKAECSAAGSSNEMKRSKREDSDRKMNKKKEAPLKSSADDGEVPLDEPLLESKLHASKTHDKNKKKKKKTKTKKLNKNK